MAGLAREFAVGVAGPETAEVYNTLVGAKDSIDWVSRYKAYQVANPLTWDTKHGPIHEKTNVPALCQHVSGYTTSALTAAGKKRMSRALGAATAKATPYFLRATEEEEKKKKGKASGETSNSSTEGLANQLGRMRLATGEAVSTAATAVKAKGKAAVASTAAAAAAAAESTRAATAQAVKVIRREITPEEKKQLEAAAKDAYHEYEKAEDTLREQRADFVEKKRKHNVLTEKFAAASKKLEAITKKYNEGLEQYTTNLAEIIRVRGKLKEIDAEYNVLLSDYQRLQKRSGSPKGTRGITLAAARNMLRRATRRRSKTSSKKGNTPEMKGLKDALEMVTNGFKQYQSEEEKVESAINKHQDIQKAMYGLEQTVADLNDQLATGAPALMALSQTVEASERLVEAQKQAAIDASDLAYTRAKLIVGWKAVKRGGGRSRGLTRRRR